MRANTLAAQPPRPVVRMQGPVVSPGGPRSIAPPSSRPLPTVTVHPQTQTPSNATSVRVQQETPSYGYATQNVYNSGQPGPRFTVAPQMRPQGPQRPQGGPPQISPGVRTPVYPQSPIQASPPQTRHATTAHTSRTTECPNATPFGSDQNRPSRAEALSLPTLSTNIDLCSHSSPVWRIINLWLDLRDKPPPAQPQPNYGAVPL